MSRENLLLSILREVRLVGGTREDRDAIRSLLGADALAVDAELRLVSLGCAGEDVVDRIEAVFCH